MAFDYIFYRMGLLNIEWFGGFAAGFRLEVSSVDILRLFAALAGPLLEMKQVAQPLAPSANPCPVLAVLSGRIFVRTLMVSGCFSAVLYVQ